MIESELSLHASSLWSLNRTLTWFGLVLACCFDFLPCLDVFVCFFRRLGGDGIESELSLHVSSLWSLNRTLTWFGLVLACCFDFLFSACVFDIVGSGVGADRNEIELSRSSSRSVNRPWFSGISKLICEDETFVALFVSFIVIVVSETLIVVCDTPTSL